MARPDFLSPIVMSELATFDGPTKNGTLQLTPLKFLNPNRTAMLVDEFRFYTNGRIFNGTYDIAAMMHDIQCRLLLGSIPLTDDFVPLAVLGVNYNRTDDGNHFGRWSYSLEFGRTYRLPKPLYVPPDVPISVTLKQIPSERVASVAAKILVSAVGRSMPEGHPKPDFIYVPWATHHAVNDDVATLQYLTPNTSTTPPRLTSLTNRLGNPHGETLHVTKFIGFYPGGGPTPDSKLFIQATLSNGKIVIRDPVPFFDVFPLMKPWLDLRAELQPKSFIRVQLTADENIYPTPADVVNYLGGIRIGLQGYRKLERPWGASP